MKYLHSNKQRTSFYFKYTYTLNKREKEGDLTQSYDKTPYTNRKFENQRTTHTNATKNFDYTKTQNFDYTLITHTRSKLFNY